VNSKIRWRANGSHVSDVLCRAKYAWFDAGPDTWYRDAHNLHCNQFGSRGNSSAYAKYHNTWFCPGPATYVKWNRNNAIGLASGGLRYVTNPYKWGGCSNLLHHDTEQGRGHFYD